MGRASSPPGRQIPLNSSILYPAARGKGSHRKGITCENHRPPHIDPNQRMEFDNGFCVERGKGIFQRF